MERSFGKGETPAEQLLETMLASVPHWKGKQIHYRPMFGGFSNSNWHIRVNGDRAFFLKMPGPGTENFIDRSASIEASQKAHALGIGPRPYDYLIERGVEISDFVERARPCVTRDFQEPEIRRRTIELYRTFNDSEPLSLTKTVFAMIEEHICQLRELSGFFPSDFLVLYEQYRVARQALEASGLDIVPCYNDPAPANFLRREDGSIIIVDFEYASNNDRCYDLAIWSGEMFLTDAQQDEAIECYFGRVERAMQSRMYIYRMLGDLKWSLWSMIQNEVSFIDFDFHKFGIWKLMRLRTAIRDPRWQLALASV
ncbi:choline/ethanolamine kinase family protein [Mesorhizobium sp. GR13]|uniref:choline/ethanolamine kinase family protein n=1 Tax=Mesorhizobium sp. GR13 TaxID=2562308 RepID=UPI0010C124D6|nr:choline/ethanolamine kinase family protein [Mesorhizobium sp. GR13]